MNKDAKLRIEQPKTLTEIVADRLRQAIINCDYGFGENISEDKLAAAFGVSRSPIRDALNALQFAGLVNVIPKKGSFVFNPSAEEVAEICDYRLMLEREALRLSMAKSSNDLLGDLNALLVSMREKIDQADELAYIQLDTHFHNLFFDYCGNQLIQNAFHLVEARIATIRTALNARFKQRREASFKQHIEIVEALENENWDRVDMILGLHISSIRSDAIDELSSKT